LLAQAFWNPRDKQHFLADPPDDAVIADYKKCDREAYCPTKAEIEKCRRLCFKMRAVKDHPKYRSYFQVLTLQLCASTHTRL
jgi:hypothetical protein